MRTFRYYIEAVRCRLLNAWMLNKSVKFRNKIVVFESDDWGSIRMPSLEVLGTLKSKGVSNIGNMSYNNVDTLASNDDLEILMDVLSSVKDKNGNPAKITLDCVVANPDFDKIRDSNFSKYYYEPFTETLKRYPNHDRAFSLWKEGIKNKLFMPQFHGREHLNFQRWMRLLQSGNRDVMACFDTYNYAMLDKDTEVFKAYDARTEDEFGGMLDSIKEGLDLFEEIFGFRSVSMIAPCYTWDDCIEDCAYKAGISYIQGGFIQRYSLFQKMKGKDIKGHYFGERNRNGQIYLTRNCFFEPSQNKNLNADNCLDRIDKLFKMGLPAIVSCHRLNFIGGLYEKNRDENLKDFKYLLETIVTKFPDVEFLSSDKLLNII